MKKLLCKLPKWLGGGHKRGKRIAIVNGIAQFHCSRCLAQWHRKVKAKSA